MFKPLEQELKEIKNIIRLSKTEEDILKELKTQKEDIQLLNQLRKAVRIEDKQTEEEQFQ